MISHPEDYERKKHQGGFWMSRNVVIGLFFALFVILAVIVYVNTNVSAGTTASTTETRRVARCVFLLNAYRAQYSQASNTSLQPVRGRDGKLLDPLAGLKLPPAEKIRLGAACQQYLRPFSLDELARG